MKQHFEFKISGNRMNTIWWKRFRPINLLIVSLTQLFFIFFVLLPRLGSTVLSSGVQIELYLIVLITLCITAGGYIINDIQDIEIDRINKPERVIRNPGTWIWIYRFLFLFGSFITLYVSYKHGAWWYLAVYFVAWFSLYAYSTRLKCIPLAGNLLVSLFSAAVVIAVLAPFLSEISVIDDSVQKQILRPFSFYFLFAFLLSLIREIVKDMEDYQGDKSRSCNTLAVSLGDEKAKVFVLFFSVLFIAILIAWITFYWSEIPLVFSLYLATVALVPMLVVIYTVPSIKGSWSFKKQEYHKVSSWLKYIMIGGILALSMEFYIV